MNRMSFKVGVLAVVVGIIGGLSIAEGQGSFDRLKDYVKVGQGIASTKTLEFDIGAGASNPTITATSTGDLVSTGSGGFVPAGAVMPYAGATAPDGWLLADGSAVSRTTYARLFAAIGTTHGVGDGTTTFNLPDLRGRTPAGKDNMGGNDADRLTSGGAGIDGNTLGAAGGDEVDSAEGSIGGSQSIAHTHNIAHAHQWSFVSDSSPQFYTLASVDDSNTSIDTGDTRWLTTLSADTNGDGSTELFARQEFGGAGTKSQYTSGALSAPSGSGSSAVSAAMSANSTVSGSNFTFTGSATNVTQPTIVLNYIIKS